MAKIQHPGSRRQVDTIEGAECVVASANFGGGVKTGLPATRPGTDALAPQRVRHPTPPKSVVSLGGGQGHQAVLEALKRYADVAPQARVTMLDAGGDTGRLRAVLGGALQARPRALGQFINDPSGDGSRAHVPLVIGVQELPRLVEPSEDYPAQTLHIIHSSGQQAQLFYVPTVTMDKYPLREVWQTRWQGEPLVRMEQGIATYTKGNVRMADPWVARPSAGATAAPFHGLVLDLPMLEFATNTVPEDGWIVQTVTVSDTAAPVPVKFRPTRYRGSRDTEPRVATAHRVWIGTEQWEVQRPQFVLVNVHLATLRAENVGQTKRHAADGVACTVRQPTPPAIFLRRLQLGVLRDFILEVYRDLQLAVIVVGDFNTSPDAPELLWLQREAHLKALFDGVHCWHCGTRCEQPAPRKSYYTDAANKMVLNERREVCQALTAGSLPLSISVTEYCTRCQAPQFSHKRNFRLLDNILYTDSNSNVGQDVAWVVEPVRAQLGVALRYDAGMRLDTYFSDHLPIWGRFRIRKPLACRGRTPG